MSDIENVFKVSLKSTISGSRRVTFDVTPDIIENRNVNYKTMDPIHMPGSIHVYGSTSSRTFNISNVKLVSRTPEEASKNMWRLHQLRGWGMPYFGNSSSLTDENKFARSAENRRHIDIIDKRNRRAKAEGGRQVDYSDAGLGRVSTNFGRELLGAPPEVLFLNAYSDSTVAQRKVPMNIHKVPVILQQLSIPYPSDVDYIPTKEGIPFPTLMTLDVTLMETHAPIEYSKFSLQAFREGKLPNF